MIQLTRLNNQPLVVNSDLIKFIENAPNTVLTLVSGEKVVVLESSEQALEKVVEFRRIIASNRSDSPQQDLRSTTQWLRSIAPKGGRVIGGWTS
jgi:uncharacterized protein YlzI (FlbEa/FlbD family)